MGEGRSVFVMVSQPLTADREREWRGSFFCRVNECIKRVSGVHLGISQIIIECRTAGGRHAALQHSSSVKELKKVGGGDASMSATHG